MDNEYYKQLAEGVFENITEKLHKYPIVLNAMANPHGGDPTDDGAVAEIVDRVHLSEIAGALNGDYSLARTTLITLQKSLNTYIAAVQYKPVTEDQMRDRIREIFVNTISGALKQVDN